MMRRVFIASILLMVALLGYAQQELPKVIVTVVDPVNDINQTFELSKEATVSFEKYKLQRPSDIEAVDLGLSVLWCSRNYYLTEHGKQNDDELFNMTSNIDFVADNWGVLYDEPWRMPSREELEELMNPLNCTWTYDTDKNGFNVESKINGAEIFIPCAGIKMHSDEVTNTENGYYWFYPEETELSSMDAYFYEMTWYTSGLEPGAKFNLYKYPKATLMSIRPVFGESRNKAKPFVQDASAQDYRSAVIQISVENVDYADITGCGIYCSTEISSLPTNSQPPSDSLSPVQANHSTSGIDAVRLDTLTSGQTYYVCAYVTTEKGTTYSEPASFTVKDMTVSFYGETAKSVTETTATVTLNLQGYPLNLISKYGVTVTGGDLQSEEFTGEGVPSNTISDVTITGLAATTEYTCTPFAVFDSKRIDGNNSLTFTTSDPHRVNNEFPIPEQGVDMGLPSKLLWAPYNLYRQDETGSISKFFGWGDPTGKKTSTGNGSDYANGEQKQNIAGTEYDIATQQWNDEEDLSSNDKWRLPTRADFKELFDYCKAEDHTENGVAGLLFTNKTDPAKTLFIPLPGGMNASSHEITNVGTDGFYWTSEAELSKMAYRLRLLKAIADDSFELYPRGTRGCIRPVYGKIKTDDENPDEPIIIPDPENDHSLDVKGYDTETADDAETAYPVEAVDLELPSGTKWAAWNVGALKYGDLGKYYAWGEITTKETFSNSTYSSPVRGYQVYDLPDSVNVVKQLWGKGSSNWTMPGEEDFSELFEAEPLTVYVVAGEAPYIYAWDNKGNDINGAWPGTKLTTTTTVDDGTKFWTCTFSDDIVNIIINNGGEKESAIQTDNIENVDHFSYFTFDPTKTDKDSIWSDVTTKYYKPGRLRHVWVRWETDSVHKYLNGNDSVSVYGMRVISRKNGKSIFFPAGGDKLNNINGFDTDGWYWTKTGSALNGKRTSHAVGLNFYGDSSDIDGIGFDLRNMERFDGFFVRPVWKENSSTRKQITP